jgi:2',3'-cyclic-nucleotide 2'-phosphodiesterase / 3'-nucleotidase / 5'-nucleotidase
MSLAAPGLLALYSGDTAFAADPNLYQAIPMGIGSGEVVSHAKVGAGHFIAVTDNPNGGVSIFKWIDSDRKYQLQTSIDIAGAVTNFKTVSSVALDPRGTGLGAAAVQIDDPAYNTIGGKVPQVGRLILFDVTTGTILADKEAGYHPDMVGFSSTGFCAVANEGEFAWNGDDDTPVDAAFQKNGSVSLYDLSAASLGDLAAPAAAATETEVDFSATDVSALRYGTAEQMEPEYVAFSPDGVSLFAGCQENNAIVVLNDVAGVHAGITTPTWEINSLGTVTYTTDASDKDGFDISDTIKGLHMPDAIAVFEQGGITYIVTADEGDARPDDSDIARAGEFASDAANKIAAGATVTDAQLIDDDQLGRINVSLPDSTDSNGDLVEIVGLGSRGISVWQYSAGTVTRVSHLPLEAYLASEDPSRHNANDGGDPGEFDKRSDDKGPEPEAVAIINLGGVNHAVVGNERQNGVVLVDLSNPASPTPVSYINSRDNGLISPETAVAIPALESPTGEALAVMGYEGIEDDGVKGGIGIYSLEPSDNFKLTILHNNDGESDLFSYRDSANHGGVARFKTAMDAHHDFFAGLGHGVVEVYSGDSFLAGAEFSASLQSGAPGSRTFYDALALSLIGYDAFALGNHEFDFGPDVLAEFIGDAQTYNPALYLSANLDFTNEADMLAQVNAGNVARSTVLEVPTEGGVKMVGIIGATTDNLPFISSPRNTIISAVASAVNTEIASLLGQNVDAIVLVSHLQGLSTDQALVSSLSAGIDVIVAGGGDELLVTTAADSPRDVYGPAAPASVIDTGVYLGADGAVGGSSANADDAIVNNYPLISTATDLGGNHIPIVTGGGSYGYLNRLTLSFDGSNVTVDPTSNPALIVSDTLDAANGYAADADVLADIAPVQTYLDSLAATVIANNTSGMTGGASSPNIRSKEQPVGNLVADAYLAKAQALADSFGVDAPQVAMANGGGIRADIPAGNVTLATTFSVSPFGNFVAVVEDVTTADLKLLLENAYSKTSDTDAGNGVNPSGSNGRFAQVAGMKVVYDISKAGLLLGTEVITTPGVRVVSAELNDGTDLIVAGEPVEGVTVDIAMPAFSAAGGDQWFRYASNGSVYYTSVQYPYTTLGATDQQALADYIIALDGTANGTGPAIDGDSRYDAIPDGRILAVSDRDSDGLLDQVEEAIGSNPDVNDVNDLDPSTQLAALAAKQAADIQTGEQNVTNDPGSFDLYTETSIQDLRGVGNLLIQQADGNVTLTLPVQKSDNLGGWETFDELDVTFPKDGDKEFYRLILPN